MVAVALAGPYSNNLHLTPDRNHASPHHSVFTGRMPFLLPNQQCQSTEGMWDPSLIVTITHLVLSQTAKLENWSALCDVMVAHWSGQ